MIIIELFAGVGGFRIGLEGRKATRGLYKSALSGYKKNIKNQEFFITGYSNQWEPNEKSQYASKIYQERFSGGYHDNRNIEEVSAEDILEKIQGTIPPDRNNEPLILVGGFPCQDYSVANGLHTSKGILGKKGVLWWHIERLLRELRNSERQPEYLLLENVDRLLKSPASNRGRDFALMLTCLESLGYIVEYRVINAADYSMPQRRRRVFIVAYLSNDPKFKEQLERDSGFATKYFQNHSIIGRAFSQEVLGSFEGISLPKGTKTLVELEKSLLEVQSYRFDIKKSPFGDGGIMSNGLVYAFKLCSRPERSKKICLRDVLQNENEVPEEFYVKQSELFKWKEAKGAKRIKRINPVGVEYWFAEGAMRLTEDLDSPSRTIITSEGGNSASRTKHLIESNKRYRRLTPVELERLNMFPDNHTELEGVRDAKRAFLMGNALVVGIVEKLRNSIIENYGKG